MEQESGYDFHADIWSLGITVLELCHGHAPFSKYPPMKVLLMTLQNPAPTLEEKQADGRHFSRALREFVTLCLQKDPSKRPSASKLLEHKFLKEAKKADWLAKTLLDNIPSLGERTRMLAEREARRRKESNAEGEEQAEAASNEAYKHGVSNWNFDVEELKAQAASMDDPTVAESDALAAANALDNLNLGSDKKGVEKKGRFEIITESSTPDQPQEQSQTSQPVQRQRSFRHHRGVEGCQSQCLPESHGFARAVSSEECIQGPGTKGSLHSALGRRYFQDGRRPSSLFRSRAVGVFATQRASRSLRTGARQESAIEELQDENARLRAKIAELER